MPQPRKTALVTGAGRNIGRAVVINGSRDRAACEAVAEEARRAGVTAQVIMGDVGTAAECARITAETIARFGAVDVLVDNAALRPAKPFLEMADEEWRRVIAVDMDAVVWLSRACLPGMLDRGWGRIVNFTGMNAIHGYAGRAPVSVAKHGVWGLTKALAKEFGPRGITVNAISPGPIAADDEKNGEAAAYRQAAVAKVPLGREGTAVEVAAVLRLLVAPGGAYVNGQML